MELTPEQAGFKAVSEILGQNVVEAALGEDAEDNLTRGWLAKLVAIGAQRAIFSNHEARFVILPRDQNYLRRLARLATHSEDQADVIAWLDRELEQEISGQNSQS